MLADMGCYRSNPQQFALRPTQTGDICIILEPSDTEEIAHLHKRQAALQSVYGGQPARPIHLTCLRFSLSQSKGEEGEETSLAGLERLLGYVNEHPPALKPFGLTALEVLPLYVPYEQTNVLKWCIQITEDLKNFLSYLHIALQAADLRSLYRPWFVPSLVTALKGIPNLEERPYEDGAATCFPQHLFTAQRYELSRIDAPRRFKILAAFSIE